MALHFLEPKTIAPGGITDTQEGLDYQWRSLTYFASRCFRLTPKVKDFELLTEIEEAKKFDDIILQYTNQHNVTKYILAQAKHKKKAEVMDSSSLIADKNYSLHKYFKSLWDILQRPGAQNIENVMIITNNTFDGSANLNLGENLKMKINQSSESLYFEKTDHFIFDRVGEIFQFVGSVEPAKRAAVFKTVRNIILSFELANVLDDTKKTDFLKLNQKYLFESLIDGKSLEFRNDFLKGTLIDYEYFCRTFEKALRGFGGKKLNSQRKIQQIENKFASIFDNNIDQRQLITNQVKADDAINLFLDKLLFVTNLKIEDLQYAIDSQLRETFRLGNIKTISLGVEMNVRKFFMKQQKELTKRNFEKFLSEIASTEVENRRTDLFKICCTSNPFNKKLKTSSTTLQI
jgi:hypothetical protein